MTLAAIFGPEGTELTASERTFFRETDPWGFILFARNVADPDQLRRLTGDLREAVGRDAPVLVDQEGGRVQRLRAPHWREWVPPLDEAARAGPRAFYLRYALIAQELRAVGIDVDCAPCCDIASDLTHPFLRNRCFGTSVDQIIANARAAMEGLLAGGCLPVVKHAPGHGRAVQDSHLELPVADASLDDLMASDFSIFHALADAPLVMTAHIVFPTVDAVNPATLSPQLDFILRAKIGLQGLVISDDMSMKALSGTLAEKTEACLSAGCDIALHCNGKMDEMTEVAKAARPLAGPAKRRADAALALRPPVSTLDPDALLAEYDALTNGA
jgi:beta-N-acetylhexosaminidase